MKKIIFGLVLMSASATLAFSMAAPQPAYGAGPAGGGLTAFFPFIVIAIILLAFIGGAVNRNKRGGGMVLVLKEFKLNENEDEFLKISGRASGFFAWLFSLLGIDPVTSLTCDKKSIKFEEAAIQYGKNTLNIPLAAVSRVVSGLNKPFALLVLGIILIFWGIIGAVIAGSLGVFILGVITGVVFLIFYKLKKTIIFGIYTGGDKPIAAICMKKSIIEGQDIDELKFEAAATALTKAVLTVRQ